MPEFLETTIDKFIFRIATDRLYSLEGVWVEGGDDGTVVRLGISDYRQQIGGDMAFVHMKAMGTALGRADEFAEVETIKATASFPSPVSGTIVMTNPKLDLSPELVNQDPYGSGWLALVQPADWQTDRAALLEAGAYLALIRKQAEKELGG
jgi:glycine cleavage system H protein